MTSDIDGFERQTLVRSSYYSTEMISEPHPLLGHNEHIFKYIAGDTVYVCTV